MPPVHLFDLRKPLADFAARVRLDLPDDGGDRVFRRDHRHQVEVVRSNAELLDLDLGMIVVNLPQFLRQKIFEGPFEDPPPVLRDPDQVVLVMVGAMGTQANLHAPIISENWPATPAQPSAGGFHPRADARGPQPRA